MSKIRTALVVVALSIIGGAGFFLAVLITAAPDVHPVRVCVLSLRGELRDCQPVKAGPVTCQEDMPCFDGSPKDSRVHTDASLHGKGR